MADASYQPPAGFLTMKQVQDRLGVSKTTLVQIVRRHGLITHRDVRDSRVRLLRLEDVERIEAPMPEVKTAA
jgi:hypothetical protein